MPLSLDATHLKAVRMPISAPPPASDGRNNIRVASFAILLQELLCCTGSRFPYLETVIATYIIHFGAIDIAGEQDRRVPCCLY
jgi:hypothetical protein